MTHLQLIQKTCSRLGIPIPSSVLGSLDTQVLQLGGMLEELIEIITTRYKLHGVTQEAIITVVSGEDQGALSLLAPNGFQYILPKTFFNRTSRIPVVGPLTDSEWEQLQTLPVSGPNYRYYLRGNHIYFHPEGNAGDICAFLYQSNFAVLDGDSPSLGKPYATKDIDTYAFPDSMLLTGLKWVWRSAKGLDYAEDFRNFETMITNYKGNSQPARDIMADGSGKSAVPGILVPMWST